MMEWIQTVLDSGTTPIVTAFLLGLLTAISPCPLATNIIAVGFIGKQVNNRHRVFWNGVLYTFGRIVAYASIGFVVIPILREGASIYAIQKFLSRYSDILMAPTLIVIGCFMLFSDKLNLPKFGFSFGSERLGHKGGVGAFLLGVLFALAFCPTSGVLYFGMLMPMAAVETSGYWLPVVYAIATGLPVVVIAWLLAYSIAELGRFYQRMQVFQRWMNRVIALLFIAVGIYYIVMLWQ